MQKKKRYITVAKPKLVELSDQIELAADITASDGIFAPFTLWYRFPNAYKESINTNGDTFLAALFPIAMSLGYDLKIEATVSQNLLRGSRQIMDLWRRWEPDLLPISIDTDECFTKGKPANKTAAFFSGGVDSFYTVLKNQKNASGSDAISHLIFIHGFDIPPQNNVLFNSVYNHINEIATDLNKRVITAATNYKKLSDQYARWGRWAHGAALASIGLALSKGFGSIYIAASDTYAGCWSSRWGSHPLMDSLWSNNLTRFIHDGSEASRVQKVVWEVSQSAVAAKHLRVCWKNPRNVYNCCKCDKCVRTMINLRVAGCEDRFVTFDKKLKLSKIKGLGYTTANFAKLQRDLDQLTLMDKDPDLQQAIRGFLQLKNALLKQKFKNNIGKKYLFHKLKKRAESVLK